MPPVPASFALFLALFSFHLAEPDKAFFARRSPPTPDTNCHRSSLDVGVLELLASCSGMSELLTLKKGVFCLTSGRFPTIGSSLPLAEISAAFLMVATGTLNSELELPAPLLKYFF
jgi:hypothetical protein